MGWIRGLDPPPGEGPRPEARVWFRRKSLKISGEMPLDALKRPDFGGVPFPGVLHQAWWGRPPTSQGVLKRTLATTLSAADVFDAMDGVQYLATDRLSFLNLQGFLNKVELEFPDSVVASSHVPASPLLIWFWGVWG